MNLPNRETIQMLWKVKKLVREVFNVTIQISQKDLEPVLISFAQRTTNTTLKALISQVVAPATITQTNAQTNKVKNLYRNETNIETFESPPERVKTEKKKQIIYRGQAVSQEGQV